MSTNKRKTFFSASALCLYWALIVLLALILIRIGGLGKGPGTGPGTGSGDGTSMLSGSGNSSNKDSDGKGSSNGKKEAAANVPTASEKTEQQDASEDSTEDIQPLPEQKTNKIAIPTEKTKRQASKTFKTVMTGEEASQREGFFGSGSIGGKVLFLLDTSSSMNFTTKEGILRIELLKRELKKVLNEKLNALASNSKTESKAGRFTIIAFNCSETYFPQNKEMLSFKEKNDLESALVFADALYGSGGTNMRSAWEAAQKIIANNKIDCVYFLSDGEPTDCSANVLLTELKKFRIKIYTFSLGTTSKLMEDIAKQHRGRYFEIY